MRWDQWDPRLEANWRKADEVARRWRAVHRCSEAYRRRVRQELVADPPSQRPVGSFGVPLSDLEIWETEPHGTVPAWSVGSPAEATTGPDHLLPRGTLLRVTGWTGDQTEGLELQTWQVVGGSLDGREIHTPLGGRYGAVGSLVDALIVDADEPIAGDARRAEALMADLERLAAVVTTAPDPELPASVTGLLAEARELDPVRLSSLARVPSDHWADKELGNLVRRAEGLVRRMDPVGLIPVLQEAISEQLRFAAWKSEAVFPMNFLVWQSIYRAALGLLAPGLTPNEQARMGEGWQAVKERAR